MHIPFGFLKEQKIVEQCTIMEIVELIYVIRNYERHTIAYLGPISLQRWLTMLEYPRSRYLQKMDQFFGRNTTILTAGRNYRKCAKALRESASGHQILYACYSRYPDLPSSPDSFATAESRVSPHTHFGPRRLRQDHSTLCLGTIASIRPSTADLGISRRRRQ
jgi:hypothetical protein